MGKFQFQRKHILPLVLLVICLALATQLFRQANQIYMMKESIQRDMESQADALVHACNDLSQSLNGDKEAIQHDITQLQDQFYQFSQHTLLYRQFSNAPAYSYTNAYQIGVVLGKCSAIASCHDVLTEKEWNTFSNFLAELSTQIRLAFSFSYRYDPNNLDEQFSYVMAGWNQLDHYMEENKVLEYAQENIFGLEK